MSLEKAVAVVKTMEVWAQKKMGMNVMIATIKVIKGVQTNKHTAHHVD